MAGNPATSSPTFLVPGSRVSARAKGAFSEANVSGIVKQALSVMVQCLSGSGSAKQKSRLVFDSSKIEGDLKVGAIVRATKEKDGVKTVVTGEIIKLEDKSVYSVVFTNKQVFDVPRGHITLLGDPPKEEGRRGHAVATEHLVKKMKMELLRLGVAMDFFTPEQREIAMAYQNQPEKKRRRPSSPARGAHADPPPPDPRGPPPINRAAALIALADAQMCPPYALCGTALNAGLSHADLVALEAYLATLPTTAPSHHAHAANLPLSTQLPASPPSLTAPALAAAAVAEAPPELPTHVLSPTPSGSPPSAQLDAQHASGCLQSAWEGTAAMHVQQAPSSPTHSALRPAESADSGCSDSLDPLAQCGATCPPLAGHPPHPRAVFAAAQHSHDTV